MFRKPAWPGPYLPDGNAISPVVTAAGTNERIYPPVGPRIVPNPDLPPEKTGNPKKPAAK